MDLIFHEDENIETITQTGVDVFQHVIDDHSYCRDINTTKCADCESKGELIKSTGHKLSYLTRQVNTLLKSITVPGKSTPMKNKDRQENDFLHRYVNSSIVQCNFYVIKTAFTQHYLLEGY